MRALLVGQDGKWRVLLEGRDGKWRVLLEGRDGRWRALPARRRENLADSTAGSPPPRARACTHKLTGNADLDALSNVRYWG